MLLERLLENCLLAATFFGALFMFVLPADAAHRTQENTVCRCSANLRFSRPSLQFLDGVLTLLPRVDISIRTRGETSAPAWSVDLEYEGEALFTSNDVPPPDAVAFSGAQHVIGGSCGDNRYLFKGFALDPVPFTGFLSSLLGAGEEAEGTVRMRAQLVGCGDDKVHRVFRFTAGELGNLLVRGWRSAQ